MKLYNTLSRKLENVVPLSGKNVRIYSCGPTVYDHAHIGNLTAYVYSDTLQRVVGAAGFNVTRAMNYTDVDDKTIRRSHEQFPQADPKVALTLLTDKYIAVFLEDMQRIGNDTKHVTFIRATDPKTMQGMRDLIAALHAKGFAYVADDGVYFSIDAYRKSGKVYGQLSEITAADTSEERIQNDEYDKESVHDFALWKTQKDGEPAWDFTLDGHDLKGRPGWHIECSVMSRQALGQPFDIHTGGVDHIFPHHENEIAQSTALEANPVMATVFVHSEHMLVDGRKMSKSLQNFYTLSDITNKGYDPLAFRVKVLQSHYRNSVNFTWESLDAAQNLLTNLRAWADLKHQKTAHNTSDELAESYANALRAIREALFDDLNTSLALGHLAQLANESETLGVHPEKIQPMLNIADQLFGLQLSERPTINDTQKSMIAKRQTAREAKNWAKSDQLRDQLKEQGIIVRDTTNGPIWQRT
ncbi:MAG TPA: cysteine--tRNA ligase [Candidatus Saccharimonadales bacterium]|nr:cysteine--tRNA ligase [Candidatus Saccharimonadales bacterium]